MMATHEAEGEGTRESPWVLKTPPGKSEYLAYRDETADPPALVVIVGKTELRYQLRCLADLQAMLKERGDWMPLGSADEQKPAAEGTVESLGPFVRQSGGRLVRPQEGAARALRQLRAPGDGGPRPGRGRARGPEQPHAGALTGRHRAGARD